MRPAPGPRMLSREPWQSAKPGAMGQNGSGSGGSGGGGGGSSSGGGGGASGGGQATYASMMRRVREELEQLGHITDEPF
jgi:hypothetical protein